MPASDAPSLSVRAVRPLVLTLTVGVFALVVLAVTLQLRAGLRHQVLQAQADVLTAVATLQLDTTAGVSGTNLDLDRVPGALFVAVLKTARYRGVVAVRVFDSNRTLNSTDGLLAELPAPTEVDWRGVATGAPFARLRTGLAGDDWFLVSPKNPAEAVEAWVPLRRSGADRIFGAAQFWLDAEATREELAAHDWRLWQQAGIAWLLGSTVIVVALGWAFRRLEHTNRELRLRSEDLQRANRELVLSAKTSALGAVAAHLMHEIKNPLAGLELLVAAQADAGGRADSGGELAAASALTRRLRTMVNDIAGVLHDEQTGAAFELTVSDVADVAAAKAAPEARARGVVLEVDAKCEVPVGGRRANLATLVLRNLLQNAIEATPGGGRVRLTGGPAKPDGVEFLVEDGGGGLPAEVKVRLFQPCTSTKAGGSGLGLALSHQLALQAGGKLELVRSDPRGSSFRLVLGAEA
ncbi:MAG: HAMP domain-containing sensor histidine kinase [Opitutaceae bacterium]